jgi:hypothetical protein
VAGVGAAGNWCARTAAPRVTWQYTSASPSRRPLWSSSASHIAATAATPPAGSGRPEHGHPAREPLEVRVEREESAVDGARYLVHAVAEQEAAVVGREAGVVLRDEAAVEQDDGAVWRRGGGRGHGEKLRPSRLGRGG